MADVPPDLIDVCISLVEARLEPKQWIRWWDDHASEFQESIPRGWYLRLMPRGKAGNRMMHQSQLGASYLLEQVELPHVRSDWYERAAEEEIKSYWASQKKRTKNAKREKAIAALADRFRKLGAHDPESWARSEIEDDIPQLARFVFLRELWKLVTRPNDKQALNRYSGPNDDGKGGALHRLKKQGASMSDLLVVVREAQREIVLKVACLLDQLQDPGPGLDDIVWGLFELDKDLRPRREMGGLHETVDDEDLMDIEE